MSDLKNVNLCSFCDNPAFFTAIMYDQGVVNEACFCFGHARDYQSHEKDKIKPMGNKGFAESLKTSLEEILKKNSITETHLKRSQVLRKNNKNTYCPNCDMDRHTILETGIFGCDQCFPFFKEFLGSVFPEQYAQHESSKPLEIEAPVECSSEKVTDVELLKKLRRSLDDFLKTEDYSEAAKIRDRIKELENKLSNKGSQ